MGTTRQLPCTLEHHSVQDPLAYVEVLPDEHATTRSILQTCSRMVIRTRPYRTRVVTASAHG